jgi:hypothetical protein
MLITADVSAGSMEFVSSPPEGAGERTGRVVVPATDRPPSRSQGFCIPFDASGQGYVLSSARDSAGNGAFTQPVHMK